MKKRAKQTDAGTETDASASGDRQFVTALQRGLDILRCFRPTDGALGNQELAQRCGLPNSTVSRLTYTLSKLGYLVYLEDIGKYRVGVPVLGLGYACLSGLKVREVAQPYLDELAQHAGNGLLVAMGGRDQFSMIYVACARSEGIVSLQLNVGSRISLARSSMGRAYLAATAPQEREAILRGIEARTDKERWPQLQSEILRAIEEINMRGFCLNSGEWQADVNSVGVPLAPLHGSGPVLALNCGGPAYLLPRERLENDIGPRMVEAVRKIRYAGEGGGR
ncbi:IclR family transcriptional regulator [Aquamicrobium sp. NLF2-7]|uniref:IclR family transcriptional regulator n=1 Tax=Aquamicrobium sp. NLF2-7 TaxID=2918753 RepID=UPI001EFB9CB7|nr:IclR family transcriptional regulator [Aquamicrobium sp. NLF2-7]MCG8272118.1 IclR family transcriptional regulator [Aquamicrobium sp. NLF2-7]